MTEGELWRKQREVLEAGLPKSFVIRKHADYATSGDPDVSITGNGMTSWWENKHATPKIKWESELQRIKCIKLARAGYCRVIAYQRNGPIAATHVVHPERVGANGFFQPEETAPGEDNYEFVLEFVRRVHSADPTLLGMRNGLSRMAQERRRTAFE